MVLTEAELSSELKSGILHPIYFLYGEESFLTKAYVEKIKTKVLEKDAHDFNLIQLKDNPSSAELSLNVESLPVFSEKKLVLINDLNAEKLDPKELDSYIEIFSDTPETTVVVIYITGFEIQKKAPTKKLLTAIEKYGVVCELKPLNTMKIADLITKKAIKLKRVISRPNAEYLAEITQCDMTLAGEETSKLCAYVGENEEITRETIDKCVAKRLDTSIYNLSAAITAKKVTDALVILDEFYQQRFEPTLIVATLAGAFIDMYHAKLGKSCGISSDDAAEVFGIKKNRAWVMTKFYGQVSKIEISYIRSCILIISEVDLLLKSSPVDSRTIIEKAIIRLIQMHC